MFPAVNEIFAPSNLLSWIAAGASPRKPSTVPVITPPSCRNANNCADPVRQRPVMPEPAGDSRSHAATCGRSFTAFEEIVTLADASPGELASTVMPPADLLACTTALQRPQK